MASRATFASTLAAATEAQPDLVKDEAVPERIVADHAHAQHLELLAKGEMEERLSGVSPHARPIVSVLDLVPLRARAVAHPPNEARLGDARLDAVVESVPEARHREKVGGAELAWWGTVATADSSAT